MADDSSMGYRIPPQDLDAEKALLGSIMVKPNAFIDIADLISPNSFYAEKHRLIYQAMLDLQTKNEPIDLLSLSTRLKDKKQLEQIGGRTYLTELSNTVPTAGNISFYANTVHAKASLRNLISASEYIHNLGHQEDSDIDNVLDQAEKKIYEVTNSPTVQKFTTISQTLGEAWDRFERLHDSSDEIRGVPSGFHSVDNILAGFQKSDLIILAARPSVGKTSLALDIARQTAVKHNIPVGFFSLEMSAQQLVDRMLAAQSHVDAWKLRTGKIRADDDFARIRAGLDELSKAPIFIDDTPGANILKLRSTARRMKSEHGLGLIVVDYLQLMAPTTTKASDSMTQQVTEISRSLKHLARELDVPVIALSQLSRAVEQRGGKPRLSDLRDSGSIEQDADVVMFIHRDDKMKEESERPNIAEILIEKHRNGPTGRAELYFDENRTTFLDVEKSDFGDLGGGAPAEDFASF